MLITISSSSLFRPAKRACIEPTSDDIFYIKNFQTGAYASLLDDSDRSQIIITNDVKLSSKVGFQPQS